MCPVGVGVPFLLTSVGAPGLLPSVRASLALGRIACLCSFPWEADSPLGTFQGDCLPRELSHDDGPRVWNTPLAWDLRRDTEEVFLCSP